MNPSGTLVIARHHDKRNLTLCFCSTAITRCSTTTKSSKTCATICNREFGVEACERYWQLFEELRAELVMQLSRRPCNVILGVLNDGAPAADVFVLVDYPFADRRYPVHWRF